MTSDIGHFIKKLHFLLGFNDQLTLIVDSREIKPFDPGNDRILKITYFLNVWNLRAPYHDCTLMDGETPEQVFERRIDAFIKMLSANGLDTSLNTNGNYTLVVAPVCANKKA